MATTIANKPIGSVFAVRSLLFLLLLNGAPAYGQSKRKYFSELETINGHRSVVSPPASDMRYMEWSDDFKQEAKELANKCELALPTSGVVYFTSTVLAGLLKTFQKGFQALEDGLCKSNETHLPCRFYRDLMEAGADRIGCGGTHCPKLGWLYYCVTNARSSNEPFTDLVYTRGTPCQRCPKSAGYCYRNLCVSHATRTAIQTTTPSAVITCDAPCVNCGERTDAENSCFCQCPKGYNSEVDCSKGSGGLRIDSACHLAGTPCRNGGRAVGAPSGPCRCLCHGDYGGQFCEIPMAQIAGGVVAGITNDHNVFYLDYMDHLPAILNNGMAVEINSFCGQNQASYLECCGSGTLPNNGSIDFVDASSVHVTCFPTAESPLKNGICTIYATAKGNNGLCRKRTSIPAPILAVPPSVVEKVFNSRYAHKMICCDIKFGTVTNSYAAHFNVGMPTMNFISVKVG